MPLKHRELWQLEIVISCICIYCVLFHSECIVFSFSVLSKKEICCSLRRLLFLHSCLMCVFPLRIFLLSFYHAFEGQIWESVWMTNHLNVLPEMFGANCSSCPKPKLIIGSQLPSLQSLHFADKWTKHAESLSWLETFNWSLFQTGKHFVAWSVLKMSQIVRSYPWNGIRVILMKDDDGLVKLTLDETIHDMACQAFFRYN